MEQSTATKAISVSDLNRQAKRLLEVSLGQVWVMGELSSLSRPSSGHWYFSLKDEKAQVRCAMFRGYNQRLKFQPKEGDLVVLQAKVSLYEGRGDYQLIVEHMEPSGVGQLQAAFEELKRKLSMEGLFEDKYKKPIPAISQKVAVITSASGAVIHDIISVTKRRFPSLEIILIPVTVQGEGAASEISAAIAYADSNKIADVIIVGRGGGSLEDLWAFNEEPVVRAIFHCETPIVSAVGHEVDFTLSDLVADYRAPTPSAAAEKISPDQFEMMQWLDQQERRLIHLVRKQIERLELMVLSNSKRLKHPGDYLREKQLRLAELNDRLKRAINASIDNRREKIKRNRQVLDACNPQIQLKQSETTLKNLFDRLKVAQNKLLDSKKHALALAANTLNTASPLSTLTRGYSITQTSKKKVIQQASDVKVGQMVTTTLKDGSFNSRVEAIQNSDLFSDNEL